jgi:hypothetical protein
MSSGEKRASEKKTTEKQKAILAFLAQGESFTLAQILAGVPEARTNGPFESQKGYLSECLKRLMARGLVVRVQRGYYALAGGNNVATDSASTAEKE